MFPGALGPNDTFRRTQQSNLVGVYGFDNAGGNL